MTDYNEPLYEKPVNLLLLDTCCLEEGSLSGLTHWKNNNYILDILRIYNYKVIDRKSAKKILLENHD